MHRSSCSCHSHNGLLTAKGLVEAAQRSRKAAEVDNMDMFGYLDKVGSVSALVEPREPIFVDGLLDEQYRRFHNGS